MIAVEDDRPQVVKSLGISMGPLDALMNTGDIELIEAELLKLPQVDCPLVHIFVPGLYVREVFMPANSLIIGHEHLTQHLNQILTGSAVVMMNGKPFQVEAPFTFESEPGVRKVIYIKEDMRWQTFHPNPENIRDIERLSERLIVKSPSFLHYFEDMKRLRELIHIQ